MKRIVSGTAALAVVLTLLYAASRMDSPMDSDPETEMASVPQSPEHPEKTGQGLPPPPPPPAPSSPADAELLEKFEALVADDLHCRVLGVPMGASGQLRVGFETFNVDVYKPEVALIDLSGHLDSGSGELLLAGFEPLTLSWTRDEDSFTCHPSEPVSAAGPFGIAGLVVDPAGLPLDGVEVVGCGESTRSESGSFYLIRSNNQACELRLLGSVSGTLVVVPAAEEDLDLDELTLPDVPAAVGLDLSLGVLAFQSGMEKSGFQVLQVLPGSPADRAGIKALDVVVSVDGEATAGRHPAALFERPLGQSLRLELGDGRLVTVTTEPLADLLRQAGESPETIQATVRDRGIGGQY